MDHIVVDVEVKVSPANLPNGWKDTHLMGVACAVVYEHQTDRFKVYGERDVEALRTRIAAADRVTSFNGWAFDYPVVWGLPERRRVMDLVGTVDDLLRRIWEARKLNPDTFTDAHAGVGLDEVCRATLGVAGKIGRGVDAPLWYAAGDWAKVVTYCMDDVTLTRNLEAFIDHYGYVVIPATGAKLLIPPWRRAVKVGEWSATVPVQKEGGGDGGEGSAGG